MYGMNGDDKKFYGPGAGGTYRRGRAITKGSSSDERQRNVFRRDAVVVENRVDVLVSTL